MASNGQTQPATLLLQHRRRRLDQKYVQASTVLSLTQVPGENPGAFRDSAWTKGVVEDLRRAQVEADLRCF